MTAPTTDAFPEKIQDVLRTVERLHQPDPFGLEEALDDALAVADESEQDEAWTSLVSSVAEELLDRCATCDAMYTYNVLALVDRGMERLPDESPDAEARIRLHCVAARALTLHRADDKSTNLAQAAQHLADADALGGGTIAADRLAAALLDFVRAVELQPAAAPAVDVPGLYRWILELTDDGAAPDVRAVALANLGDDATLAPTELTAPTLEDSDADALESALESNGTGILRLSSAAAATRLAERLLTRAATGDGPRAIRWLQAGERSYYYYAHADSKERARNQLGIARYFSLVNIADADDEYVRNKALLSVQVAYAVANGDPDIQAACLQTAAHVWAPVDRERARGFLDRALAVPDISPLTRGRLHLDRSRAHTFDPERALPDAADAVANIEIAVGGSRPAAAELDEARELQARLLVSAEFVRTRHIRQCRIPAEAVALMSLVATGAAERGELANSYLAYRRIATWFFEANDPKGALVHYAHCRDVAQAMLDRDAYRQLADELHAAENFEAARAAAIARPSSVLRAAHEDNRIAVQIAAIDHQVAAFCAARLGQGDDAVEWAITGRLRNLRHAWRDSPRRAAWTRNSLATPGPDVVIVIPLVQESGTIVLLGRGGRIIESFPIDGLTHRELRRRVYDADDHGSLGWLAAYQHLARDTPFCASTSAIQDGVPHELWWLLLQDAIASIGQTFAVPLHSALADRGLGEATMLLIPPAILSLLPLHAMELADGRPFFVGHPTELGFTPSLPGPSVRVDEAAQSEERTSGAPRSVLAVAGENELLYTSLELRTVARLFGEHADVLDGAAATRERLLAGIGEAECLHVASHGVFNAERWLDSRIELGRGESITLRDTTAQGLSHVRLVVLSACESGVSHARGLQEEFLGFPSAFAIAGAQSVLCTLWRINDLSAALLLERFYTVLLGGERAAVALRDARAWLRTLTAGELLVRAQTELAAPRKQRAWRAVECSGIIGRFEAMPADYPPFQSPYHWAAFTLWSTQ